MIRPVQITTEVWHDADGSTSRTQTVVDGTMAKALAAYRLLAEMDALIATGEALERISGE